METFHPGNYPGITAELLGILKGITEAPVYFKKDIIISYLRDHSIRSEWINTNPLLVKMMTSGIFVTTQTEKLFDLCRWNKQFRLELEQYIKEQFN